MFSSSWWRSFGSGVGGNGVPPGGSPEPGGRFPGCTGGVAEDLDLDEEVRQNPEDDFLDARLMGDRTLDRPVVDLSRNLDPLGEMADRDLGDLERSVNRDQDDHLHLHHNRDPLGDLDEEGRATDGLVRVRLRVDLGLGAPQESEVNAARRRVSKIQL